MFLRKPYFLLTFFFLLFISFSFQDGKIGKLDSSVSLKIDEVDSTSIEQKIVFDNYAENLYHILADTALDFHAFKTGLKGYYVLAAQNKLTRTDTFAIIDFSKPSNVERFYIVDLCSNKILHKSLVAHGKNTGGLFAENFSNKPNSLKSSIGFYLTGETYRGKFDLALRLEGLEYTNSKAKDRGVVIHAADYATKQFLRNNGGQLGRSYGCPALPHKEFDQVVDWIKGGTCVFAYYPDEVYQMHSKLINSNDYLNGYLQ
ncbi:murein L,D-transpeptidase catalytic domain family protein [Crocinitomix catalasitica]|uniref:murein L,D-transpeptidase catalytic domain family protein n=1 Tax=Crocinitomix catalasitica TaxID=184607 RepID=UPI0006865D46|nr:murein L,D-transpeptidase catalytic domain family protein [Crocinitomix catalasitica]